MEDLKSIIAKNLIDLRTASKMTQLELAEKLNYTDKAVSKWERAESIPDITVLKQIADLFEVTVDYLLHEEHPKEEVPVKNPNKTNNHIFISGMSIILVWLIATIVFVFGNLVVEGNSYPFWLAYVYAIPVSMIVLLVFSSVWFKGKINYFIISLLMWTVLAATHLTFIPFYYNPWLLYVLGVPGQIIIILWSRLKYKK